MEKNGRGKEWRYKWSGGMREERGLGFKMRISALIYPLSLTFEPLMFPKSGYGVKMGRDPVWAQSSRVAMLYRITFASFLFFLSFFKNWSL